MDIVANQHNLSQVQLFPVEWHYNLEDWQHFLQYERKRYRGVGFAILVLFVGLSSFVGLVTIIFNNQPLTVWQVMTPMIFLMLGLGFYLLFSHLKLPYPQDLEQANSVILTPTSICWNERKIEWGETELEQVDQVRAKGSKAVYVNLLVFRVEVNGETCILNVPVPAGKEVEAETILRFFKEGSSR
jgi:hypothetical protein